MLRYTTVPFDYHATKAWFSKTYPYLTQDDLEDRYHDALECFLRYWNGVGNPVGAVRLAFSRRQDYHGYNSRLTLDILPEVDITLGGEEYNYIDNAVDDVYSLIEDRYVQEVVSRITDKQKTALLLANFGLTRREIGAEMGVTHQAVNDLLKKVINKL